MVMDKGETIFDRERGGVRNREDLALLQFVLQDDIARATRASQKALEEVARSQRQEQFQGQVVEKTLACTPTPASLKLLHEHPYTPWAQASFYNAGPGSALIAINTAQDWSEVEKNRTLELDFRKADRRIEVVYYKAAAGTTATVTATGKW